jgi:hypothetical protein
MEINVIINNMTKLGYSNFYGILESPNGYSIVFVLKFNNLHNKIKFDFIHYKGHCFYLIEVETTKLHIEKTERLSTKQFTNVFYIILDKLKNKTVINLDEILKITND